jgi:hypothetical protein
MKNKVVLITGGLTGIGRATALAFAQEGARIVVSGRHEEEGQKLVGELRKFGAEAQFVHLYDSDRPELKDRPLQLTVPIAYQEIRSAKIPKATSADGLVSVSVIAGEAMGEKAVIETRTPIIYVHYRIEPGGMATQQVPHDYNAFAYIIDGLGLFGAEGERGADGQMVMLAPDGDEVRIENPEDAKATLEVLVIAGVPLNEPIARYGPFVMNTETEIHQAFEDYRQGRMGAINS